MPPRPPKRAASPNTRTTKRQKTDPQYIGATLEEVRQAIREGRLRYAQRRDRTVDARGAGTKRLTRPIARHMITRWWKSPPGTRIVVGFVHSDAAYTVETLHEAWADWTLGVNAEKIKMVVVAVERPKTTAQLFQKVANELNINLSELSNQKLSVKIPFYIFNLMFQREAKRVDHDFRQVLHTNLFSSEIAWKVDTYSRPSGHSHVFVWPAGIVNNRTSNGLNKIQDLSDNSSIIPYYNNWRRDVKLRKAIKALDTLTIRRKHARVMNELRAVPAGAIHPSFPGGQNYRNSLTHLEKLR